MTGPPPAGAGVAAAPATPGGPGGPAEVERARLHRSTLRVLVASQVLGGLGLAAGITVGALLAEDVLGRTGLAGLPVALFTLGSAVAALAVGAVSERRGRRVGLAAGYLAGAAGGTAVVVGAALGSAPLLLAALLVYGAGTATSLQARYAGGDLAPADRRGTAVSTVLVATTLGAVAGPLLVEPTGRLAAQAGLPALTGPFVLASTAYAAAAVVLLLRLRPDPLLTARRLRGAGTDTVGQPAPTDAAGAAEPAGAGAARATEPALAAAAATGPGGPAPAAAAPAAGGRGDAEARGDPAAVRLGAVVMVVTQLVMVAVMTMTPVHLRDHGHGLTATGVVIGLHVAAMFLPSPVTGRLADRHGSRPVAVAGGASLVAAGLVAATAPGDTVALVALALVLLGLGWNLGLLAGTALLTGAVPVRGRARVQGRVDVAVALSGAAGGVSSGAVVAAAGFAALSLAGGAVSLVVLAAALRPVRAPRAA